MHAFLAPSLTYAKLDLLNDALGPENYASAHNPRHYFYGELTERTRAAIHLVTVPRIVREDWARLWGFG